MIENLKKRVVIIGSTGFIGRALSSHLLDNGYDVIGLTRNKELAKTKIDKEIRFVEWDGKTGDSWKKVLNGAEAVVNLAGESIASGLWTKARKERILLSRIDAGRAVSEAIRSVEQKPRVWIQASAIGYYPSDSKKQMDESSPPGTGFLSGVCQKWEDAALGDKQIHVRRVVIRSGLVLGSSGGILEKFRLPFRFFAGGTIGSPDRWLSWIHILDEIRAIRFLIENSSLSGIFNLTSPDPVSAGDLCSCIGKALNRSCWLRVPGIFLRAALGKFAEEILLSSQFVRPKRLIEAGFDFQYSHISKALNDLIHGAGE